MGNHGPEQQIPEDLRKRAQDVFAQFSEPTQESYEKQIARLRARCERLSEALQLLMDNQNGCPLPKYEADWNRAMQLGAAALADGKESSE